MILDDFGAIAQPCDLRPCWAKVQRNGDGIISGETSDIIRDSEEPEKKGFLDKYVFLGFKRMWLSTQIL